MLNLSSALSFSSITLLLAQQKIGTVVAQSSCSAAQRISAPFQTSQGSLQEISNVDIFQSDEVCSLFDTSDALGAGRWYSYTPSRDIIAEIQVQATGSGSFLSPPKLGVFEGSCSDLGCHSQLTRRIASEVVLIEAESGVQYYFFLFSPLRAGSPDPYSFAVNEIAPPPNDQIENAFALSPADLPYRGDFTTYGAFSDFDLDACGLFGNSYGVWFAYTPTVSERLSLEVDTGNVNDVVGIQVQNGNGFTCIARGSTFGAKIEWTAEGGRTNYILVADPSLLVVDPFEFKLQSLGAVETPSAPLPAPTPMAQPPAPPTLDPPMNAPNDPSSTTPNEPPSSSTRHITLSLMFLTVAFWCLVFDF